MGRVMRVIGLTAVMSLAVASIALAALTKVTGGTTTLTASDAAAKLLTDNHITVTPLAPATASGKTFTFPITGGKLNIKTRRGVIRDGGGVAVSNGTTTVNLRRPTIVSDRNGVSVFALLRGHVAHVCRHLGVRHARVKCVLIAAMHTVRIARVTGTSVTGGTATGTARITAFTAHLINRLAGKQIATAGDVLGSASVTPTLK